MVPGAPGASMAPAHAPAELGFDSGRVSATTLRKRQNHPAWFSFMLNHGEGWVHSTSGSFGGVGDRRQKLQFLCIWTTTSFFSSLSWALLSFFFDPKALSTFWAVALLLLLHFPQTLQRRPGLPRSELRVSALPHRRLSQALWRLPSPAVPAAQLPLRVPKYQTPLAALRASWW